MKRFLPLLMLTGLLFGQDTTIVLENGRTLKGTIVSETDSTYRIMGESWRVTDGVYEVFNTFINISKNETVEEKELSKQDGLILKSGESYKGRYVKKVDELIVFQVEGENHFTPFPINDVAIIKTSNWGELTYPFNIPRKEFNKKLKILLGCAIITVIIFKLLSSISITLSGGDGGGDGYIYSPDPLQ